MKRASFHGAVGVFLVFCLVCGLLCLSPLGTPTACAASPWEVAGTIIGAVDLAVGVTDFIFSFIHKDETKEQLEKIQRQLEQISRQLEQIQAQLDNLQKTVEQLAKNLEIDTKEIENYIQNVGAQAGIDSIKTHYGELQDTSGKDVRKMTYSQIQQQQAENQAWCTNVLGTWDIKNAITKIGSAVRPDTPMEGVLQLWTDQAILKMPPPGSEANDFSVSVESTTGGQGGDPLPVVVERPQYFDYDGIKGGSVAVGFTAPSAAWYFAEGTCRPGFQPFICVCNPGNRTAEVKISYMLGDGAVVEQPLRVPARSRRTANVKDVLGEGDDPSHDFSAKVESVNGVEVVAERIQYFLYRGAWDGGSCSSPMTAPVGRAFFAEGTARPNFDAYITVMNPGDTDTGAVLTYVRGDGTTAERRVDVPAHTRVTVKPSDTLGAGDGVQYDFSTIVESTTDQGLVSELPMYCNYNGMWAGGTCLGPVAGPSTTAYLAEGTCRPEFETYYLVMNPGPVDTDAVMTCMRGDGTSTEQRITVPAHTRVTLKESEFMGVADDASHDFSGLMQSQSAQGLVVSRAMYFIYQGRLPGCHGEESVAAPASKWYFAEGTIRPGFDSYLSIQNPNEAPVDVDLNYMWGDGRVTTEKVTVPARARATVKASDVSGARTLANYYESLKSYFTTLLYFQNKGAVLIAEAYNLKYMQKDSKKPAPQTTDYLYGSYRRLIQSELEEFLSCVESLVSSWSNVHSSSGLAPGVKEILSDADALYMCMNNALNYTGTGNKRNFYGAFGRVFARQSDTLFDANRGVGVTGGAGASFDVSTGEQSWRPVRLKYYDPKQQKLIQCNDAVGVARFHQNCEPGDYQVFVRNHLLNSGGSGATLAYSVPVQVADMTGSGGEGTDDPVLPFGDVAVLCQPSTPWSGFLYGVGGEGTPQQFPAPLKDSPQPAIDIASGEDFCAYLRPGSNPGCGSLAGWGSNELGQLNFPEGDDFVQLSAGEAFCLAVKKDGSLAGWGCNWFGNTNCPKGKEFAQVAAGSYHGVALKRDGSLVGWGRNLAGETICPAGNDFVQVAAGRYCSLALKKDGSIVGWGSNEAGVMNVPAGNDFVQIAAGSAHGLALKKDGSVVGWGSNYYGQIECPAGNAFVRVAASASAFHSIAVKKDSTMAAWGRYEHGQIDVPGVKSCTSIAGGNHNSLFIWQRFAALMPWTWR